MQHARSNQPGSTAESSSDVALNHRRGSPGLPPNIAAAVPSIHCLAEWFSTRPGKRGPIRPVCTMQSILFGAICFVLVALFCTLGAIAWSIPVANIFLGPLWGFLFAVVKLGLVVLLIISHQVGGGVLSQSCVPGHACLKWACCLKLKFHDLKSGSARDRVDCWPSRTFASRQASIPAIGFFVSNQFACCAARPERVTVDRAILLPRQMLGGLGRQSIQRRDETKRRMRARHVVAFHQIFREQEIPHRGQDCDKENPDGGLA